MRMREPVGAGKCVGASSSSALLLLVSEQALEDLGHGQPREVLCPRHARKPGQQPGFKRRAQAYVIYRGPAVRQRSRRVRAHEFHARLQIAAVLAPRQRRQPEPGNALEHRGGSSGGRHLAQRPLGNFQFKDRVTRRASHRLFALIPVHLIGAAQVR